MSLLLAPQLEDTAGDAEVIRQRQHLETAIVESESLKLAILVELTITGTRSGAAPIFTAVLRDIRARRHAEATRARLASGPELVKQPLEIRPALKVVHKPFSAEGLGQKIREVLDQ
jgi:hypothetical protein